MTVCLFAATLPPTAPGSATPPFPPTALAVRLARTELPSCSCVILLLSACPCVPTVGGGVFARDFDTVANYTGELRALTRFTGNQALASIGSAGTTGTASLASGGGLFASNAGFRVMPGVSFAANQALTGGGGGLFWEGVRVAIAPAGVAWAGSNQAGYGPNFASAAMRLAVSNGLRCARLVRHAMLLCCGRAAFTFAVRPCCVCSGTHTSGQVMNPSVNVSVYDDYGNAVRVDDATGTLASCLFAQIDWPVSDCLGVGSPHGPVVCVSLQWYRCRLRLWAPSSSKGAPRSPCRRAWPASRTSWSRPTRRPSRWASAPR